MATGDSRLGLVPFFEQVGRATVRGVEVVGHGASLAGEGVYWVVMGRRHGQVVRAAPIADTMMEVGVRALPIVTLLSMAIGLMLCMQGIHSLRRFGAEGQVVLGVALSVTREFAPLITGILVAGRSGSALAARVGTMTINQEVDALRVMGVSPVRSLVSPALVGMLIMLPVLTMWSDLVALLGAGLYVTSELGITMATYVDTVVTSLSVDDLMQGITKSAIFAVLITIIGVVNGATVEGGAEGVGKVTTAAVVQAITAIIVTDMIFVFAVTR
jgi:phospholipid/cholesterol/gamma-HCH transport system permease protein